MISISYLQMTIAIVGALAVLLLMLMYLLIRKKIELSRNARIQSMKEKVRPLLIREMLNGDDEGLKELKDNASLIAAIEDILKNFESNFDSSSFKRNITETAEKYLAESLNKGLDSNRWAERMNALMVIKDFQIYSFVPLLWERYDRAKTSRQEKNLILQTAAGADDSKILDALLTSPPYQSTFFYKQIIRRVSTDTLNTMVSRFEELPSPFKVAVLSYIGEKRDLSLLPFTETCLDSKDHEVRVNAVKAIRNIGFISNPKALYPYSASSSWVEQMSFAQAAGEIVHPGYRDMLIELLASSNWWVRYYAGEALTKYRDGRLTLEAAAVNHPDAFARDMASQWLGSV
ncbi:HEAT repeat domain-containing protein [Bacillus sp. SCS-153A]|uniref:HEAT repeat domain-containing protein n=1 Tax=Rossellomorea sedimentorum TaxID=3115294 RepID=UPI003905FC74